MLSSQSNCVIVSGFRAALDLETYPLSNLFRPPWCAERAKPGRGKPVLIIRLDAEFTRTPEHRNAILIFKRNHVAAASQQKQVLVRLTCILHAFLTIHHDKHTQYSFDAVLYLFLELLLQKESRIVNGANELASLHRKCKTRALYRCRS